MPTLKGIDDLVGGQVIAIRIRKNAINPFGKGCNCLGGGDSLTKGQQRGNVRDEFDHYDDWNWTLVV